MTRIDDPASATSDRRSLGRQPFEGSVTLEFVTPQLRGKGQDLNTEGVLFVAEGTPRVKVRIEDTDVTLDGELVRIQSMDSGRVGIAVRFVDLDE